MGHNDDGIECPKVQTSNRKYLKKTKCQKETMVVEWERMSKDRMLKGLNIKWNVISK